MHRRKHDEAGDTLIEIVIAIVIIGLVVSTVLATYSTQSSGSITQRRLVTADGILRSYAESIKSAVRADCGDPSRTTYRFTPPAETDGYVVSTSPNIAATNNACPPKDNTQPIVISVSMRSEKEDGSGNRPFTLTRDLSIAVRTP